MFFKGTKKRPGNKVAFDTESFGGEINAFTSFDYTCYYINAPFNKLKQSLEILMDMVANPLFSVKEIPSEKRSFMRSSLEAKIAHNSSAFKNSKNRFSPRGIIIQFLAQPNILRTSQKSRLKLFAKNYNRSNLTVVIAGDIKNKSVFLNQISKYSLPKGKSNIFPNLVIKQKPTLRIHEKDVEMVQVSYTIPSRDVSHPNSPADDLAWNCIGSGESSLLYNKMVQEDSLCNSASAFSYYFKTSGIHMIKINCPIANIPEELKSSRVLF